MRAQAAGYQRRQPSRRKPSFCEPESSRGASRVEGRHATPSLPRSALRPRVRDVRRRRRLQPDPCRLLPPRQSARLVEAPLSRAACRPRPPRSGTPAFFAKVTPTSAGSGSSPRADWVNQNFITDDTGNHFPTFPEGAQHGYMCGRSRRRATMRYMKLQTISRRLSCSGSQHTLPGPGDPARPAAEDLGVGAPPTGRASIARLSPQGRPRVETRTSAALDRPGPHGEEPEIRRAPRRLGGLASSRLRIQPEAKRYVELGPSRAQEISFQTWALWRGLDTI
jgi:hypothetical protein